MLSVVVGIALLALLALLVANMFGNLLAGWLAIWASTVGLALLIVDGLHQHEGHDAQQDADVAQPLRLDLAQPLRLDVTSPVDEDPRVATELMDDDVELHPEIWPPEHPAHKRPGYDNRTEPRRASEGESPHPDIWP
jgi:hypothetical protein